MAQTGTTPVLLRPEPYPEEEFRAYLEAVIRPLCAEKHQQLLITIDTPPGYYLVLDKLCLNKIVFHLLNNASKYTPESGIIHCLARGRLEPDQKHLKLHLEVQDNGIGISQEFQKRMFEEFSQENRNDIAENRGSGLGLALTHRLLKAIGGKITVQSEIGKGSTFSIDLLSDCLPAAQVEAALVTAARQPFSPDLLQGKHVLLCEDHPLNCRIIKDLLRKAGIFVDTVENGLRALEQFQLIPLYYYDAILMDIRMPIMDGLTAATRLRALNRPDAATVPIIALTANVFKEDVQACLAAGMNEHLAKPINPADLYAVLTKYLTAL